MRYALTGATGFIGGALAKQLSDLGHHVIALVRDPARAGHLSDLGAELVPGDLDKLCHDADGIFHVAGWYKLGSRNPQDGRRVNVDGTRNALEAARRAEVPRVVYTSTLAVNSDTRGEVVDESYRFTGRHLSVYDETKSAAHDIAREFAASGLPIVTAMPGLVYGPGDTSQTGAMIARVCQGKRVVVPADGGVCWAHVDDIAEGHRLAMDIGKVGSEYMLAGPRASLADGLSKVASFAGTKRPIRLPDAAISITARAVDLIGRVIPLPADYAAETLRASLATYYGTPTRSEAELGWSCRDLDEGLAETVRSFA